MRHTFPALVVLVVAGCSSSEPVAPIAVDSVEPVDTTRNDEVVDASQADAIGPGASESGQRLEIRRTYMAGEDGSKSLFREFIYDTELDTVCSWGMTADGVTRCIPLTSNFGELFWDAECTKRATSVTDCSEHKYFSRTEISDGCFGVTRIYAVGDRLNVAFRKLGNTCEQSAPSDLTFYKLGPEMRPIDMVKGELVTE